MNWDIFPKNAGRFIILLIFFLAIFRFNLPQLHKIAFSARIQGNSDIKTHLGNT